MVYISLAVNSEPEVCRFRNAAEVYTIPTCKTYHVNITNLESFDLVSSHTCTSAIHAENQCTSSRHTTLVNGCLLSKLSILRGVPIFTAQGHWHWTKALLICMTAAFCVELTARILFSCYSWLYGMAEKEFDVGEDQSESLGLDHCVTDFCCHVWCHHTWCDHLWRGTHMRGAVDNNNRRVRCQEISKALSKLCNGLDIQCPHHSLQHCCQLSYHWPRR